jgi:glycyl-tRNA synthetase beta subunit
MCFCRLDSLVGLFAAGCQPSSASDPFGLRRISYGLVSYTIALSLRLLYPIMVHLFLLGSSVGGEG